MKRLAHRFAAHELRAWEVCVLAGVLTAAAMCVRLALDGPLGGRPTLVLFTVPIMLSAYAGGLRGGLVATALSSFGASYYLLPPIHSFHVASSVERFQQFFVVLAGVVISVVNEALHRARRRVSLAVGELRRAQGALVQSNARYEAVVHWSPEPVAVHRGGRFIFVNPAAAAMFGAPAPADLLGRRIFDFIHPSFHDATAQRMTTALDRGRPSALLEIRGLKLDGCEFDIEVQGTVIDYDGAPALMASMRDVSVRKAYETEIGRLSRTYAALSAVNQAIVRMPGRDALFATVCNALVEQGGMRLAWIGWRIPDAPAMAIVAVAGDDGGILKGVTPFIDDRLEAGGPVGPAFREGRPVVCNDMRTDPTLERWRPVIERAGLRACAVFPIRENGVVAGVLSVSADQAGFFQDREIALLAEAADDISFALDNLAREDQRTRSDRIARESTREANDLRDAIDQHALVAITDPRGKITFANDRFCEVSGYSRAELIGQDHRLINSGHHPAEFIRDLWTTIERGAVWRGEIRNRSKSGAHYWVDTTIVPFLGADGTPRQYMAIRAVITERHDAIEAVRVAAERIRFALESASVGIWDLDVATGALTWSPVAEAHYGVAPGTFGGTLDAFMERVHPDDRAGLRSTLDAAMKAGGDYITQHRARWPDGTVRSLRGSGRIIHDAQARPVRGVGISQDVTEQRTMEAQFQQAQKMEAIGRLAGGVAHDFNNLLTVILGFCELVLADLGADSPHAGDVAEIQRAGQSAAGLTRQLLAFSRKQIIEPTRLDLNEVVLETRAMLSRVIGEDVSIVLDLDPNLAVAHADRAQLEQILMNLAVNARDAMPDGGTLTIATLNAELDAEYARTHLAVQPGRYVSFTVSDTGVGMSPEVQARLFEPFFTTKEVGKGTGLGLATVHGIVARSGGSVQVDSEPGVGTSFKVFLPVAGGGGEPVEASGSPARVREATQTVLVVDDAEGLRELTRRLLERLGYNVLVAGNADEALGIFATGEQIDLLLTDVVMPGSSGPQLSKELVARRPGLRVLYMSGYTDEAIVQHGVLNPGVALLNKPFTLGTLATKLREVLDRRAEG
ncbi:MAG: Blue-light-activated protein, partial [Myxococcaceae bacterium]|nr:Blue-light-activated protein [Myxococcaceae bacterium]